MLPLYLCEDKCILCKNKKLAMCLLMIHWQIPVLHYSVFSGQRALPFPSIRKVVLPALHCRLYIQNNISRLFAATICIACQLLYYCTIACQLLYHCTIVLLHCMRLFALHANYCAIVLLYHCTIVLHATICIACQPLI